MCHSEVAHALKDTAFAEPLKEAVISYAQSKGEYNSLMDSLTRLYTGKPGYETNFQAKMEKELVADLIGKYLFTDTDFVRNLSVQNRNLFQRLLDEIKYLLRIVKAGSKEAKQLEKIKKLFEEAYRDAKNTAPHDGVKYSISKEFAEEVQNWFDTTTHNERKVSGKRFLVGTTTDVLKSIGVKDYEIYFGGAKIDKILQNNQSMSLEIIKQAVMLLEDPILIMESQTVEDSVVVFGEVYTKSEKPVMISVLLNPKTKTGEVLDYAVITSAYGRREGNLQNLIDRSKIYYINDQKSRTDNWLKALGLQLPSAITKYGSINRISDIDRSVNPKMSLSEDNGGNQTDGKSTHSEDVAFKQDETSLPADVRQQITELESQLHKAYQSGDMDEVAKLGKKLYDLKNPEEAAETGENTEAVDQADVSDPV